MSATRVERKPKAHEPRALGFSEKVALFVSALHRERCETLLEGFATESRQRATQFASQVTTWDSARRQARLTHEFGARADAATRLKQVVLNVQGPLRAAVVAALPASMRQDYPQFHESVDAFGPVVRGLASRLVKEAAR